MNESLLSPPKRTVQRDVVSESVSPMRRWSRLSSEVEVFSMDEEEEEEDEKEDEKEDEEGE